MIYAIESMNTFIEPPQSKCVVNRSNALCELNHSGRTNVKVTMKLHQYTDVHEYTVKLTPPLNLIEILGTT